MVKPYLTISSRPTTVQPQGSTPAVHSAHHHHITPPSEIRGSQPQRTAVALSQQQLRSRTACRSGPNSISGGKNTDVINNSLSDPISFHHSGVRTHLSRIRRIALVLPVIAITLLLSLLLGTAPALGVTIPATKDLSCVAARISNPVCTAGDFEVITTFSAAPNTPPFCMEGESFEFEVDVNLTSKSPDRYDIGFFFGQNSNDPASDTSNNCSVATFPTSYIPSTPPSLTQPWGNFDNNNVCSDFYGGGSVVTRVNKIKVMCQGNSTGALLIPYTLVYDQNAGTATDCSGPANVRPGSKSKCQGSSSATVSGTVKVFSGAYVDVTKQTLPAGESQTFSYTATGPPGSSVIAVTNPASWSPLTGGTYTPAVYTDATNSVTVSLSDGQTARFLISALDANQTLTITEAATAGWNSTAAISCSAVTGSPPLTTNNGTRTITAGLSKTNIAAACTVTNEKLATVTIVKQSNGGTGSFSFSGGSNGLPAGLTLDTGSGNPKSSPNYTVTANNTATAITEAIPAGWALNAASTSCTDGSSTFGTLAGGTLTIPAVNVAPGKNITCNFVNALSLPNLTVLKTAFGVTSGATAKTGQDIPYQITVTNTGTGTTANVIIQDQLSPYVSWKLGSLVLTQGTPPSGMTLTFPPAALFYSYSNGPWVSTAPISGGGGAPAGYDGTVTGIRIDLTAAGTMDANDAAFIINYLTQVK